MLPQTSCLMPCPVTAKGKARDDKPDLWEALADSSSRFAAAAAPAVGAWPETEVPVGKLQADALLKEAACCVHLAVWPLPDCSSSTTACAQDQLDLWSPHLALEGLCAAGILALLLQLDIGSAHMLVIVVAPGPSAGQQCCSLSCLACHEEPCAEWQAQQSISCLLSCRGRALAPNFCELCSSWRLAHRALTCRDAYHSEHRHPRPADLRS